AVGGLLHTQPRRRATARIFPESHQRSWWIVDTQPTRRAASRLFPNPTNAVGGLFILSLADTQPAASYRIPPTQLVDCSYSAYKTRNQPPLTESHQRSWWIVHTQPTRRAASRLFPNPTNAVGGLFILSLADTQPAASYRIPPTQLVDCSYSAYKTRNRPPLSESHQRSWWIVHTQPRRRATSRLFPNPTNAVGGLFTLSLPDTQPAASYRIPPTQLVDCSYSAYKTRNRAPLPESHQRSWWIAHTQPRRRATSRLFPNPTNAVGGLFILSLQDAQPAASSRIPPTQLVDCSYSAYKTRNRAPLPESHQRSWWIAHTQPRRRATSRLFPNPTNA